VLAAPELEGLSAGELGRLLDRDRLASMEERPMTARGDIDNPHGRWLEAVMEGADREGLRIRREASEGTPTPPGRRPE
jgi:hypothetical protein